MVVIHTEKEESMCWSGSAGCRAVFSRQYVGQAFGRAFGVADFYQSTDDSPYHMFEKTIGVSLYDEVMPLLGYRQSLEVAQGIFIVGEGAFE